MKKSVALFSLLPVLVLILIPSPSHPFNLTLNNTPTQVYFSPRGGCTEALINQIDLAKTEILVQAYSFTSVPETPNLFLPFLFAFLPPGFIG